MMFASTSFDLWLQGWLALDVWGAMAFACMAIVIVNSFKMLWLPRYQARAQHSRVQKAMSWTGRLGLYLYAMVALDQMLSLTAFFAQVSPSFALLWLATALVQLSAVRRQM